MIQPCEDMSTSGTFSEDLLRWEECVWTPAGLQRLTRAPELGGFVKQCLQPRAPGV